MKDEENARLKKIRRAWKCKADQLESKIKDYESLLPDLEQSCHQLESYKNEVLQRKERACNILVKLKLANESLVQDFTEPSCMNTRSFDVGKIFVKYLKENIEKDDKHEMATRKDKDNPPQDINIMDITTKFEAENLISNKTIDDQVNTSNEANILIQSLKAKNEQLSKDLNKKVLEIEELEEDMKKISDENMALNTKLKSAVDEKVFIFIPTFN